MYVFTNSFLYVFSHWTSFAIVRIPGGHRERSKASHAVPYFPVFGSGSAQGYLSSHCFCIAGSADDAFGQPGVPAPPNMSV
jgi:hypothetical protein